MVPSAIDNFPYAAFFVVDLELIRVVGVLHGKRHPRRWQRRRRATAR